jgi:hypothetical protein
MSSIVDRQDRASRKINDNEVHQVKHDSTLKVLNGVSWRTREADVSSQSDTRVVYSLSSREDWHGLYSSSVLQQSVVKKSLWWG